MATIVRRPRALDDALAIWRYIAADSDIFADAWLDRIDAKLDLLARNPSMGRARPELAAGLRSVTVGNYVIYYLAVEDGIDVVRILHGTRDVTGQMTE